MDRYNYTIQHVPGTELYTADALFRAPEVNFEPYQTQDEAQLLAAMISEGLPASRDRLHIFRKAQQEDPVCSRLIDLCQQGWPSKYKLPPDLRPYWPHRGNLTVIDELLLYGCRIMIPQALRKEILSKLHSGHLGIQKCQERAKESVWWLGVTKEVEKEVKMCRTCAEHLVPSKEPLMQTPLPPYPWHTVGTDLFHIKDDTYLLVVDYYSRYPEVCRLVNTTSRGVIQSMKQIFSRTGIPVIIRSDNGPQYDSEEFKLFAREYNFDHCTSSPPHPQGNGFVERAVKTMKQLLTKSPKDPYLTILNYRAAPLHRCRRSPSELLMGRKLRTTVPTSQQLLIPKWNFLNDFEQMDKVYKRKQKHNFDKRHRVRELPKLHEDDPVIMRTGKHTTSGTVTSPLDSPRSYRVNIPTGEIRRNRQHLVKVEEETVQTPNSPMEQTSDLPPVLPCPRSPVVTRSRTGTVVPPPKRFIQDL